MERQYKMCTIDRILIFVNDIDRHVKLVGNKNIKYAGDFDEDLSAVHKKRGNVKLDKFKNIGFVVKEKVKNFMYEALYDYFEKQLDCSYHYTDTDSNFININIPLDSAMWPIPFLLCNLTHIILVVPPIHKNTKTTRYFFNCSLLKKMFYKTSVKGNAIYV